MRITHSRNKRIFFTLLSCFQITKRTKIAHVLRLKKHIYETDRGEIEYCLYFIWNESPANDFRQKMIMSISWIQHIYMELFGLLLLIISYASPFTSHLIDEQQFAMEPQDQVAVVGTRVILPCRVLNKKGILQWTKDDFGLGTRRRLAAFERYSMIGSDEEGDYSLNIYPVQLEDDAKYQW